MKWCLTNTGVQTDRNGNIVPVKNQPPKQRIDGTAALLDRYAGNMRIKTNLLQQQGIAMKPENKHIEIQESRYVSDKFGKNHLLPR